MSLVRVLVLFPHCNLNEVCLDLQVSGEATLETDDLASVREVKLAYENVKVVDCLDLSPEGCAAWDAALKR